MMIRVKQFMRGIFGKITEEDIRFVKDYLDEYEFMLFMKLTKYEKLHTIAVARKVYEHLSTNRSSSYKRERIIKGALLHDIGKIECPMNLIEKSLLVLMDKTFGNKLRGFKHKKIRMYYNHGEIGYTMLKNREYSEELLNIIKLHHKEEISCINKSEVELVKLIDSDT